MKVIYHPNFTDPGYSSDPAAREGRIQSIIEELKKDSDIEIVRPKPASRQELELVHDPYHVQSIKQRSDELYNMSKLSAGGSLLAGEHAYEGFPTFAVIRPPGHHASPDSSWGFCYFNNMAVAIEILRNEGKITSAFIMDFDLHVGDGNINCLKNSSDIRIMNPSSDNRSDYLRKVEKYLDKEKSYDILGVSAGFDQHVDDWGGKLKTEDYRKLGTLLRNFSKEKCNGKRFALLEGGYNHKVLGKNVCAFVQGFSD
ncbi:MAG: histone deacetylase family protein [Candidatus Thermoplasmatota archaeon]|nr:histone deacetylase family protein [Candidatus Thermoplasmatota archaeon]